MPSKPNNSEQVYETMVEYCSTKQYTFPDEFIRFMAEECFLTFESRGWGKVTYWPALAKKWVLRNSSKQVTVKQADQKPEQTVRDILLKE